MTTQHPPWLTRALKEVGYHEGPNNDNKYGKALGMNNVPWCDLFVTRMCQLSRHPLPSMQPGMKTGAASVWYSMRFAQQHGLWHPSWKAGPGWQIVYGWQGPGSPPAEMHTGLVISSGVKGATGHTVEGNRGDQVGRHTFTVGSSVVLGCIDLPKLLLGRERIKVTPPKPDPQPRNPAHPTHTGPAPANGGTIHADLSTLPNKLAAELRKELATLHIVVKPCDQRRKGKAMNAALKYLKAHVALIGAGVTWALATFPPDTDAYKVVSAVAALLTALGVLAVPNKRKAKR